MAVSCGLENQALLTDKLQIPFRTVQLDYFGLCLPCIIKDLETLLRTFRGALKALLNLDKAMVKDLSVALSPLLTKDPRVVRWPYS